MVDDPRGKGLSLGVVESIGHIALVCGVDTMVKAANVDILGTQASGGGRLAVWIVGDLAAVSTAVSTVAQQLGMGDVKSVVIASPRNEVLSLASGDSSSAEESQDERNYTDSALGFVETVGFVPLVSAIDKMLKAANVRFVGVQRSGGGVLTALFTGEIAAIRFAVDSGYEAARASGTALGSAIIAHPDLRLQKNFSRVLTQYQIGHDGEASLPSAMKPLEGTKGDLKRK